MRRLKFIIAVLITNLHVLGQTNIQVVIKNLGYHKIDKVDAFDLSQVEMHEYVYQDTLNISFKKSTIDCYNIRFFENGKMYRQQFWLDTGEIKIEAHLDSSKLVIDTVLNSPMFYKYQNFTKQYAKLYKSHDTVSLNNFLLDTYQKNIQNPFSLLVGNLYIGINQNSKSNLFKLKALCDEQGEKFSWFFFYTSVNERLNKIFTVENIDMNKFYFVNKANDKIKLSLSGADYYVLDFWFLTCPPCISDHKEIKSSLKRLKQKRVTLISISTDENINNWKKYLAVHQYNWQNYLEDKMNTITEALSINSFPTYIVLDKTGNIISTFNSFSDVLKKFHI